MMTYIWGFENGMSPAFAGRLSTARRLGPVSWVSLVLWTHGQWVPVHGPIVRRHGTERARK